MANARTHRSFFEVPKNESGLITLSQWRRYEMQLRSKLFIPFTAQPPGDAVLRSHRLLLQAGYFAQSSSGIYTALPLGQRMINLSLIVL